MITEAEVRLTLKDFPLYRAEHDVRVILRRADQILQCDTVLITYRTKPGCPWGATQGSETTHFDLQVEGDTCYLVEIGLNSELRGVGLGEELYTIAESIARQAGCNRIVMHASGTTITGNTRKEYAMERGYREIPGSVEVEKIL
ncbi:MAG: GNAT family N-acetyltransferase [Candidatus Aenigmarchaeota archaeon]|nr:GNAT family N-acetyltransferase [Candidatus Aenigmarchaeota archaeon]